MEKITRAAAGRSFVAGLRGSPAPMCRVSNTSPVSVNARWKVALYQLLKPATLAYPHERCIDQHFNLWIVAGNSDGKAVAEIFGLEIGTAPELAALPSERAVEPERQADAVVE